MQIKLSNLSERVSASYGLVKQIMGHRPTATDEKHDKDRLIDLLRYWHTIADCAIALAGDKSSKFHEILPPIIGTISTA
ncbi:hypothetical protein AO372_0773 [Moraxella catarrhalis]|uniref:hypothetical protein n=1 Tax=Moraxella catarrhalis TaxID=480 RepID=UPI0007E47571|nr:hypothetical protein [Moraxella catarrhalis]OAV21455.1 hypothetical protein AO372_0773 [Moraxella catarrhalis]